MVLGTGNETVESLRIKLTAEQLKVQTLQRRVDDLEGIRHDSPSTESVDEIPESRLDVRQRDILTDESNLKRL
jgi:hypothetical protein